MGSLYYLNPNPSILKQRLLGKSSHVLELKQNKYMVWQILNYHFYILVYRKVLQLNDDDIYVTSNIQINNLLHSFLKSFYSNLNFFKIIDASIIRISQDSKSNREKLQVLTKMTLAFIAQLLFLHFSIALGAEMNDLEY